MKKFAAALPPAPTQPDYAQQDAGLPHAAAALAYAGALPLILAAMIVWLQPITVATSAAEFMSIYGICLLAFFGGVRWGIAVMRPNGATFASLVGAILPFLAAFTLLVSNQLMVKLALIIAILPLLLIDDLRATRRGCGAPSWYLGVRVPLTALMASAYIVAICRFILT